MAYARHVAVLCGTAPGSCECSPQLWAHAGRWAFARATASLRLSGGERRCQCGGVSADGLPAVERKGFFATHRGLLEVPHVWETILDYIDLPVGSSTAQSSANAFPESHAVSAGVAATQPAGAADPALKAARTRKHVAARREGHERSKPLRDAWEGMARRRQGGAGLDSRTSVEGGWVMVHGKDAPGGPAGARNGARMSTESGEVIVNPLHERGVSGSLQ